MTGAKRIVATGVSSAVGVRDDDRPAGVAHAMPGSSASTTTRPCAAPSVIPLPHHDWADRTVGVLRCRTCEELTTDVLGPRVRAARRRPAA